MTLPVALALAVAVAVAVAVAELGCIGKLKGLLLLLNLLLGC